MDDVNRFEQFCQFRQIIRGSKEHLIVGIDVAKDKHHAFFGTAYGETLWRRLIFTNDLIGYQRLVEQTELLLMQHQLKEAVFGLEPTGNYHWYLDPQKIAGTDFNLFVRHVTTTDRGLRQVQRLKAIHQAAERSVGLPVDASACFEARDAGQTPQRCKR